MLLLTTNTVSNSSIVSPLQVLSYPGHLTIALVVVRLKLQGIAANGVYTIGLKINDILLMPASTFSIPAGNPNVYVMSREIVLEPGDTIKVTVTGLSGDTSVTTIASLYSVTPLDSASFLGTGSVLVNQDYPTVGAMTVLDSAGLPITGCCIYIYTSADFTANRLTPEFIVARSMTTTGGVWATPVSLDPGNYVAYVFRQGVMTPTSFAFTVA